MIENTTPELELRNELSHETGNLPQTEAATLSQIYIQAATSKNTRRAYQQDIRHFMRWGGVLPTTPDVIIAYLHHYATLLNARTLMRRLTAIKNWHIYQGFSDPTAHPLVRKTLSGIRNLHGKPKEKALALQVEDLVLMINYLKKQDRLIDWRNIALLQIGFFGALRRSELVAIRFSDLNFVSEGVEILIPRSKTDQTGEGQVCAIPWGDLVLCPPTALKIWCEKANITQGYVFRGITRSGQLSEQPLEANYFSRLLKNAAQDSKLPNPERYSGHSLRRGFAVAASQQGVSLSAIMQQGRWKDAGTAIGYMEEGRRFESNAAGIILQKRNSSLPENG
jgi:integrase